jgi:hypothetical protein
MEQKPTMGRIVLYHKYGTPGGDHSSGAVTSDHHQSR